jgi:predicted  nucleic acid-binding Zn-ribbon protein
MPDGRAKVEKGRREVASLKAQLSKVNLDITNLEQEHGKPKEEMRELQVQKAVMAPQQLRHESEVCDLKHKTELLRNASDHQTESQEQEAVGLNSGSSG